MNAQQVIAYYWSERERVGFCGVDGEMMAALMRGFAERDAEVARLREALEIAIDDLEVVVDYAKSVNEGEMARDMQGAADRARMALAPPRGERAAAEPDAGGGR